MIQKETRPALRLYQSKKTWQLCAVLTDDMVVGLRHAEKAFGEGLAKSVGSARDIENTALLLGGKLLIAGSGVEV